MKLLSKNKKFGPYLFFLCIFGVASTLFNVGMTSMSAIYIVGSLGGSNDTASYAVTIFGLGNAIVIPLADFLRKTLGFQRSVLYCFIGFLAVTFGIAAAPNYPIFLLGRFFQGFFSGPLFIILLQFANAFANAKWKPRVVKFVMLNFLSSPILGACFGGTIAYESMWRLSFVLDGFLLLCIFVPLLIAMWPFNPSKESKKVDWIGWVSFSTGVLGLGFFLTLGQELDWFRSELLCGVFGFGVVFFSYFIVRSLFHPNPIVDLSLLRVYKLTFSLLQMAILFSTYFGIILLLSLWLSLDVNYTANWIGIVLLVMMITAVILVSIFWSLSQQESLVFLGLGIIFLMASSFYSKDFNVDIDFGRIAIARVLAGAGFAFFFPPVLGMCLNSCTEKYRVQVLAYFQLTRVLSSSLGAAIYTTLWQRRHAFYHSRLGGELTPYSIRAEEFFAKLKPFSLSKEQQLAELAIALDRQSKSLAINDCLYLMGWLMVALLIYLLLSARAKSLRRPTS